MDISKAGLCRAPAGARVTDLMCLMLSHPKELQGLLPSAGEQSRVGPKRQAPVSPPASASGDGAVQDSGIQRTHRGQV